MFSCLTVSKTGELEAAQVWCGCICAPPPPTPTPTPRLQAEGRTETLLLAEEGVGVKVPIGAELIQSPGGWGGRGGGCLGWVVLLLLLHIDT